MNSCNVTESFLDCLYNFYFNPHSYISICLGSVAIVTNIFMMVVLTRRSMLSTVNTILTAVAFCDSIVLIMYVTYVIFWRIRDSPCGWLGALFEVVFADVTLTLRGLSLWYTVAMAALRYQVILSRDPSGKLTNDRQIAYRLIALCSVGVLIMGIPVYFTTTIDETFNNGSQMPYRNDCSTHLYYANGFFNREDLWSRISFWSNGICFRLLPCAILTFYIPALIIQANRKSPLLQNTTNKHKGVRNRTTFVLAAITTTSWLCETPHSILSIICGFIPEYMESYKSLGDIFDLLTLINSFLTFVLYCGMSQKFRETFVQCAEDIFCCDTKGIPKTPGGSSNIAYRLTQTTENTTI